MNKDELFEVLSVCFCIYKQGALTPWIYCLFPENKKGSFTKEFLTQIPSLLSVLSPMTDQY